MREHPSSAATFDTPRGADIAATPGVEVTPLDYTQLRLMAECAVGVEAGHTEFFFRQGRTLERSAPGSQLAPDDVVIPTYDPGKYPANKVTLEVDPSGAVEPEPNTPLTIADAVFWSDAAVQKFVFPYVASCAGTRATEVLGKVQGAWNFYPEEAVDVYALVHVTRFAPETPLKLEDAIVVAFVPKPADGSNPPLQMLPLDAFLREYPPSARDTGLAADVKPVPYDRGIPSSSQQFPDYVMLRAMAEWACSLRNKPMYFLFRAGEHGFGSPTPELPLVSPGDVVVPAFTPAVPAERPALQGVWFQPDGAGNAVNLGTLADALFWSTGSIEQFLYPYYASKGGLQSLDDLSEMTYVWTGTVPQGVGPEEQGSLAATRELEADGTGDETVYGLIHLPSSEWTTVEDEPDGSGPGDPVTRLDLHRELRVVSVDRGGVTHVRSLAAFRARHSHRRG